MPTYVYHCDNCGYGFEQLQKFSDAPIEICPVCQTRRVRKVLQPAGIQFKGSGWYVTDSRSNGATSKASAESKPSSESKPAESASSSSESKPASAASDD
jgi:putative FmdB family regulatory protein